METVDTLSVTILLVESYTNKLVWFSNIKQTKDTIWDFSVIVRVHIVHIYINWPDCIIFYMYILYKLYKW